MTVLQFISNSPVLTFFVSYLVLSTLQNAFRLWRRSAMVLKHGWPPAHLDADGDWKDEEVEE